jgi:protein-S-isoprenylcysteine O-methyltransferase Ste14
MSMPRSGVEHERSPVTTPGARLPSLGPHGEGWLAGQIVLIVTIIASGFVGPRWPLPAVFLTAGITLATLGLAVAAAGIGGLGSSLTPLPKPRRSASLRRDGVFARLRHPIYGGALVAAMGWSLATRPLALVPTAVAAVFLDLKSRREEAWLAERYPEYAEYRARVRWRFIPGVR